MIIADSKYGVYSGRDAAKGINQAIQDALESGVKTVKIPAGNYYLEEPINIFNKEGFACLNLIGDSSWLDWTLGTQLNMTYNEGYGIGVQLGKGVRISGVSVKGRFNPNLKDFYHQSFDDFSDPNIKDDHYYPYAAISIDPFNTGGGGSTGTIIDNVRLFNTCVGVASSPNGGTRNAELTIIEKAQFGYNKVSVSTSHDQERNCVIRDAFAWEAVHTFFASNRYGVGIGGSWTLENINIAGMVNTFIEWRARGYFNLTLKNINTESLGRFGVIDGKATVSDCEIGFVHPSSVYDAYQVEAMGGVVFKDSKLRYYGQMVPVNVKGNATFINCDFEKAPFYGLDPYYSGNGGMKPTFKDCYVNEKLYNGAEPEFHDLQRQWITKGKSKINGGEVGNQVIYMLEEPPYGYFNCGMITEDGVLDYCPVDGYYYLLAIK